MRRKPTWVWIEWMRRARASMGEASDGSSDGKSERASSVRVDGVRDTVRV